MQLPSKRLQMFLDGNKSRLLGQMRKDMQEASRQLQFETAARLRDEIHMLETLDQRLLLRHQHQFSIGTNPGQRRLLVHQLEPIARAVGRGQHPDLDLAAGVGPKQDLEIRFGLIAGLGLDERPISSDPHAGHPPHSVRLFLAVGGQDSSPRIVDSSPCVHVVRCYPSRKAAPPPGESRLRIRVPEQVVFRELENETVLLNLATGFYYGLDDVGTRMWRALEKHGTLEEAAYDLLDEFEVDGARLQRDLQSLTQELCDQGLLEVVSEQD